MKNTTHDCPIYVEYLDRQPSDCIEVRYSKRGKWGGKLLSFAVYESSGCCAITHRNTTTVRKQGVNLEYLLAVEQSNHPDYPTHIV